MGHPPILLQLLPGDAQRLQGGFGVSGIAVLMVGQLRAEHLIEIPAAILVGGHGLGFFSLLAAKQRLQRVRIAFADISAGADGHDLLRFIRPKPQLCHSFAKLISVKSENHGKVVDLLLMALLHLRIAFFILVHRSSISSAQNGLAALTGK